MATLLKPGTNAALPVSLDDVRAAHARVAPAIVRTPTLISRTLSKLTGAPVYLKFENLQFTAAYKERGALNKLLLQLRGFAGARRDRRLGRQSCAGPGLSRRAAGHPGTIVMPTHTPTVKVTQTEGHGANVILHGENVRRGLCLRARAGGRARADHRPSVRRSAGHRGPGHGRDRDARGRAPISTC
jgi:threonine dehydratase